MNNFEINERFDTIRLMVLLRLIKLFFALLITAQMISIIVEEFEINIENYPTILVVFISFLVTIGISKLIDSIICYLSKQFNEVDV